LIDDISHELRTPTTNINLYLDLMIKGNPQRRSHYQEVMRSEITRLEKLVAGIIQLSEFDTLRTQMRLNPVRLNHIAQQVAATFAQAAADKKLVLSLNLAADLPLVAGDEKQLTEAVRHLMANAINYTHTGHIHLRTFTETAVCLTITDTGMGIADDDLPHIFDRFYRGQSVSQLTFPGAGLGLCVVEEIVKLHGGEVTVTSQLGQGSTFAICLPAA
jgi:signal transduction histidine kinase